MRKALSVRWGEGRYDPWQKANGEVQNITAATLILDEEYLKPFDRTYPQKYQERLAGREQLRLQKRTRDRYLKKTIW